MCSFPVVITFVLCWWHRGLCTKWSNVPIASFWHPNGTWTVPWMAVSRPCWFVRPQSPRGVVRDRQSRYWRQNSGVIDHRIVSSMCGSIDQQRCCRPTSDELVRADDGRWRLRLLSRFIRTWLMLWLMAQCTAISFKGRLRGKKGRDRSCDVTSGA